MAKNTAPYTLTVAHTKLLDKIVKQWNKRRKANNKVWNPEGIPENNIPAATREEVMDVMLEYELEDK